MRRRPCAGSSTTCGVPRSPARSRAPRNRRSAAVPSGTNLLGLLNHLTHVERALSSGRRCGPAAFQGRARGRRGRGRRPLPRDPSIGRTACSTPAPTSANRSPGPARAARAQRPLGPDPHDRGDRPPRRPCGHRARTDRRHDRGAAAGPQVGPRTRVRGAVAPPGSGRATKRSSRAPSIPRRRRTSPTARAPRERLAPRDRVNTSRSTMSHIQAPPAPQHAAGRPAQASRHQQASHRKETAWRTRSRSVRWTRRKPPRSAARQHLTGDASAVHRYLTVAAARRRGGWSPGSRGLPPAPDRHVRGRPADPDAVRGPRAAPRPGGGPATAADRERLRVDPATKAPPAVDDAITGRSPPAAAGAKTFTVG
ncbi:hypothetical protein STENM327S_03499 [Streptomyces tendae]